MKVAFRVDCTAQIGTGHLMRCLTLANSLKEYSVESVFFSRHAEEIIPLRNSKFRFQSLQSELALNIDGDVPHAVWLTTTWQQDAAEVIVQLKHHKPDVFFVDHYALDSKWERTVKSQVKKLVVLDDLADRAHDCDLLIDGNVGRNPQDYLRLLIGMPLVLSGTDYLILRQEFKLLRAQAQKKRAAFSTVNRVLVFLGGTDPMNITYTMINEMANMPEIQAVSVDVVMGSMSNYLEPVRDFMQKMPSNWYLHIDTKSMANLMLEADLSIGATGSSTWERCCLGLPTLSIFFAENQRYASDTLQKLGVIRSINYNNMTRDLFRKNLQELLDNSEERHEMSLKCFDLVDGMGAARIINQLLSLVKTN